MKDEELEQIIEKSFSAEPDYHLPLDFAKKVTKIVSRREQSKDNWQEYLYIAGITIFLLAAAGVMYYFSEPSIFLRSVSFIAENILPIISIIVILSFILFADRVLLRFLFSWSNRVEG